MPIVAKDLSKRSKTPAQSQQANSRASRQPRAKPASARDKALTDEPSYPVGYKKPPKDTQYQPGQSGNLKGRPKGAKGVKTVVLEVLGARAEVRTSAGIKKMSKFEAVIHKMVELAMKGNVRALMQLIALYSAAVPEKELAGGLSVPEELTATDAATLDEFRAWILEGKGDE